MKVGTSLVWICALTFSVTFSTVKSDSCRDVDLDGSESDIVNQLTDPCRYDKLSRPSRTEKTAVFVHIHVYSIGTIDAQNMRYTAQILLRFRWSDPRLEHGSAIEHEDGLIDRIWSPHLYIVNEQESNVMGSSRKDIMNSLRPDGTVIHLSRTKVTLQCVMDLQKFPFDSQRCPLIMESWRYNVSQLQLVWEHDSPITTDSYLQLPEYSLVDILINQSINQYGQKGSNPITDYYGKVGNTQLQRSSSYYYKVQSCGDEVINNIMRINFGKVQEGTPRV